MPLLFSLIFHFYSTFGNKAECLDSTKLALRPPVAFLENNMCYLLISLNLARSFVLLIAILEGSFGGWDSSSLSNEVPENFHEEFFASSEPFPVLDVDNLFFNDNNEYLDDAMSTASGNLDSSITDDLFAIANDEQQSDECSSFPILSSPLSRDRSKRAEEACSSTDFSGTDAPVLGVTERIKQLWCSKSADVGFQNIPVIKTYGPDMFDTTPMWSSPEFPSYEPAVPVPGSLVLRECKLSKSHSNRMVVAFHFSSLFCHNFVVPSTIIMVRKLTMLIYSDVVGRLILFSS